MLGGAAMCRATGVGMKSKHVDLTVTEQRYLERAEAASHEGMSLRRYYQTAGLSESSLCSVRHGLIRNWIIAPCYQTRG
jgi:hypothetical protein